MFVVEKRRGNVPVIKDVPNIGVLRNQRKEIPEGFRFVEYPIDGGHVFVVVNPDSRAHCVTIVETAPEAMSRNELFEIIEDIWGAFSLKAA